MPNYFIVVTSFLKKLTEKKRNNENSERTKLDWPWWTFTCEICTNSKPRSKIFKNNGCVHPFCSDCIAKYIQAKIGEKICLVKCPCINCDQFLDPPSCRKIIPETLYVEWSELVEFHKRSSRVSEADECPNGEYDPYDGRNIEEKKNDELFMKLAKRKMWNKCPRCEYYIEHVGGCLAVRCCRCGTSFTYKFGISN